MIAFILRARLRNPVVGLDRNRWKPGALNVLLGSPINLVEPRLPWVRTLAKPLPSSSESIFAHLAGPAIVGSSRSLKSDLAHPNGPLLVMTLCSIPACSWTASVPASRMTSFVNHHLVSTSPLYMVRVLVFQIC